METEKPQISIIVPVYNVEKYLDKCLSSILSQTFTDFELILVDDGSTDGSGEICDRYAESDARVRTYHQKNQGQAVARNYAIRKAKGEYLGFVDSDDWIEPDMYGRMMLSAHEDNADIVICRLQTITEKGSISKIIGYDSSHIMSRDQATSEILRDEMMPSFPVNKIYRRSLFEGVEFPPDRYFEDTATIYKVIFNAKRIVTIPYIGYNYRFNPNSTCNNKSIDYSKIVKREYDNALAFGERYMFCKNQDSLSDVKVICADKAYMRMRAFLHLQAHKGFELSIKQKAEISDIMSSFSLCDLKNFSWMQKLDVILYRYCRPMLFLYLRFIALIHPMSREI